MSGDKTDKRLVLCPKHPEYPVPLIWTFSFRYKEYWCAYCGYTQGMWGDGDEVDNTPELANRLTLFKKASEEFLHAQGVSVCAETMWEGKYMKPDQLPEEEKARLATIRDEWQYGIEYGALIEEA